MTKQFEKKLRTKSHIDLYMAKRLAKNFSELKYKKIETPTELYFSRHFFERMVERDLVEHSLLLFNIVKWYYVNHFQVGIRYYHDYLLRVKNIGVCLSITHDKIRDTDRIVVKTVYDLDNVEDKDIWVFDSEIELTIKDVIN